MWESKRAKTRKHRNNTAKRPTSDFVDIPYIKLKLNHPDIPPGFILIKTDLVIHKLRSHLLLYSKMPTVFKQLELPACK